MKTSFFVKKCQKTLPSPIKFKNQIGTETILNKSEIISIATLIQIFKNFYEENGMTKPFLLGIAPISERISLEFDLFRTPSDLKGEEGEHCIYLSNRQNTITL